MLDRKRIREATNSDILMEVLRNMDEEEFEDYITELEDLYYALHPELKEDIY